MLKHSSSQRNFNRYLVEQPAIYVAAFSHVGGPCAQRRKTFLNEQCKVLAMCLLSKPLRFAFFVIPVNSPLHSTFEQSENVAIAAAIDRQCEVWPAWAIFFKLCSPSICACAWCAL